MLLGWRMAIGRTFPEVIQKALRMLDIGVDGLDFNAFDSNGAEIDYRTPTPLRLFAIAKAMSQGVSVEEVHKATMIDRWFLHAIDEVVAQQKGLQESAYPPSDELLRTSKRLGFSDKLIARDLDVSLQKIMDLRRSRGIVPHLAQIDR